MSFSYLFPGFLLVVSSFFYLFSEADDVLSLGNFTLLRLTEANFVVQRPYDLPVDARYSFTDGVRRLWVYAKDKPHDINSHTSPRSEVRLKNIDYSSGVRHFQGYAFVPNGTSGVTIFQIFGAPKGRSATTFMLDVYDGNLMHYNRDLVATQIYDKWFRLNVLHDVYAGQITVFIDGAKKYSTKDKGPAKFYFKFGVYAQVNRTNLMESRWKDIKIYMPTLYLP